MNLLKSVSSICLCICIFGAPIFANDIYDEHILELPEHDTLTYAATVINSTEDIVELAKESVSVCYNAFKSDYDWEVAKAKEKYGHSSATQIAIIQHAKSFGNQIIAQIDTLAKQLSPEQRQTFWTAAEGKIKYLLQKFCSEHGCNSTGDLNQWITNQINLKKKFG